MFKKSNIAITYCEEFEKKMERKHAFVIALLFVLVGMMFFSVDTPMVSNHQEISQSIPSPQEVKQIADEPDSSGNMLINVNDNPSFEDWSGTRADTYDWAYASTYRDCDFAYHGPGVTGNYGLLMEVESSNTHAADGLVQNQNTISSTAKVEPGISISLNWNVLLNEPYSEGANVYVEIQTWDGGSTFRNFFYLLSRNGPIMNGSIDAWFYLNDTIGDWHSLSRNITEDYIAVWGSGDLNSNQYVRLVRLHAYSYSGDAGLVRVAWDDIILTNGTYSGWVLNGNFETGTQSNWYASESSMGHIEQSTDSVHETYSMNMSSYDCTDGGANVNTYKYYNYPFSYFASAPGLMYVDIDWKYDDTDAIDSQSGRLTLTFTNQTGSFYFYLLIGTNDNTLGGWSNFTSSYVFKMPGFSNKGTWQHSRIDVYDYLNSFGITNVSLDMIEFVVQNNALGESNYLLVDNFQIITYPLGDPGFEEDWYMDSLTPFAGWEQYNGNTDNIKRTTDAYEGNYACNLTGLTGAMVGVSRQDNIIVHPNDLTSFAWRIDEIGDEGAWAIIRIRYTENNNYVNYVLGAGSSQPFSNGSNYYTFFVESFNTTGTWNLMQRNLTADYEEAFGPSSNIVIDELILRMGVSTNDGLTILFDEMHFIDGTPPIVDNVLFTPSTPMYYEDVEVTIWAHDARSGIDTLYVDYNNGTGWYGLPGIATESNYTVTIPAHAYGTTINFLVSVNDNSGVNTIDNNGGSLYSFTFGDDIDPTLAITNPTNNTDQEGLLAITADAFDAGAGVEYVTFNPDGVSAINDYSAPYSQNWNLDDESLGTHFIDVTVRDNAGQEVTKRHYITVVDTIAPTIDSPADIMIDEDDIGEFIVWDPTDVRPDHYVILEDGITVAGSDWNSSVETISYSLDDLAVGTYNYTCIVYDAAGNSVSDSLDVTVNEIVTTSTPTTDTTSTTTPGTSTQPTTTVTETTNPTPTEDQTMLLLMIGAGGIVVVLVVVVIARKRT